MKTILPLVSMALGGLLVLFSFAVPTLFPATTFWTDADAAAFDELEDKVIQSEMQYKMAQARDARGAAEMKDDQLPPALQDGIARLKEMRAENEAAAARPGQIAAGIRYAGIAVLLVGVIAHFAMGDK